MRSHRVGRERPTVLAMGFGLALVVPAWGCAEQTCDESLSCHSSVEMDATDASVGDAPSRVEASDASAPPDADAGGSAQDVIVRMPEAGRDARVSDASGERPPPCNLDGSPGTTPCQVDERYAVFVAPVGGLDSNPGSRLQPFSTLQAAVEFAAASNLLVFACSTKGAFVGHLILSGAQKSTKIYGGYDCDTWQPTQTATQLTGVPGEIPLQIHNTSSVHLEGFQITAQSDANPSANSVAAYVRSSSDIEFVRVSLIAGNGKDGADGVMRSNYDAPSSLQGNMPVGVNGGAAVECFNTCHDGARSQGGKGGYGGIAGGAAASGGEAGTPDLNGTGEYDGKGGTPGGTCSIGIGHEGASAFLATPARGASRYGQMTSAWTPASGADGTIGGPGQGGGGGAGRQGSGGGSGGCGGCGGAGGTGGKGGGSSFALLSYDSDVTLRSCHLETGKGGRGGRGGAGQDGQRGGSGGAAAPGCPGGGGGGGGGGGKGGGGAGGLSVAVAYVGRAPIRDNQTTTRLGDPGAGGEGLGMAAGLGNDAGAEAGLVSWDAAQAGWDADVLVDAEAGAGMSDAGPADPTRGVAGRSAEEFELPVPEPEGDGGLSDAGDEAGG